jgi:hypothetical protein
MVELRRKSRPPPLPPPPPPHPPPPLHPHPSFPRRPPEHANAESGATSGLLDCISFCSSPRAPTSLCRIRNVCYVTVGNSPAPLSWRRRTRICRITTSFGRASRHVSISSSTEFCANCTSRARQTWAPVKRSAFSEWSSSSLHAIHHHGLAPQGMALLPQKTWSFREREVCPFRKEAFTKRTPTPTPTPHPVARLPSRGSIVPTPHCFCLLPRPPTTLTLRWSWGISIFTTKTRPPPHGSPRAAGPVLRARPQAGGGCG